jgi:hypothetical protein
MSRTVWIAKGIARLVAVVLLSLLLAGMGYVAIIALIVSFPPHTLQ